MAYSYEQILAVDPSNPANVARAASITIFAPGDATKTPLTLTDTNGSPLANPLTVNANGFGPAFMHATLDRVAWEGGGFTGFLTSYEGMKEEATAARTAAEQAAADAAEAESKTLSAATVDSSGRLILTKADQSTIEAGVVVGPPGANGAPGERGEPGIPGVNAVANDTATAGYINSTSSATKTALNGLLATSTLPKASRADIAKATVPTDSLPVTATVFTEVAGTKITTPAHADFAFADDFDISALVALDDWSPTPASGTVMMIASRGNDATANQFRLEVTNQGGLTLRWWPVGAAGWTLRTTAAGAVGKFLDGAPVWVRAVLDRENSAGVAEVMFYSSANGRDWVSLGATSGTTLSAPTTINNPASEPLQIGSYTTNGISPLKGKVYEVIIRDGIDGRKVADYRADVLPHTDPTGKVWTLTGAGASIVTAPASSLSALPGRVHNEWQHNATSYSNNLTEWGGFQFAAYWGSDRYARVAKRAIGSDAWTVVSLQGNAGAGLLNAQVAMDGHNVLAIHADANGFLHLAGNMHGDWLKYARSTAAGDITTWEQPGMIRGTGAKTGTDEGLVSYPRFFTNPVNGQLFFMYRNGGSGNGDTYLNKYDTATKTWARVVQLFDGTTTLESVYENTPVFDSAGVLHLSFMWAPTGGTFNNRNDLSYMKSADGGVTWTSISGGAVTVPVTHTATPKILDSPSGSGLLNQTGMCVDQNNRPHIAYFWAPDGNRNIWHLYWNGTAWINERVTDLAATKLDWTGLSRPAIVHYAGRLLIIWRHQFEGWRGKVWATDVTVPGSPKHTVLADMDLRDWEPAPDYRAVRRGSLNLLVTRVNGDGATPVPGYSEANWARQTAGVLTVDLTRYDQRQIHRLPKDRPTDP